MGVINSRLRHLLFLMWGLAGLLFLRVLFLILSEYHDYFPPNFDSAFLTGRASYFRGSYSVAFYTHIIASPFASVFATVLVILGLYAMPRFARWHRLIGRVQIGVVLGIVFPSGMYMAFFAMGGWPSLLAFVALSIATAVAAAMALHHARAKRFVKHRRWAIRLYVLLCAPLLLRLVGGALSLLRYESALGYQLNAWLSWLLPLAILELSFSLMGNKRTQETGAIIGPANG